MSSINNLLKSFKYSIKNIPWWPFLLIFLLFFHSNHPLDSDEGVILEGAWNLINGRELYIDFFEFISPGSFYLIFWLWKIVGVTYLSANLISIIALYLSAFGVYKIVEQLSSASKFNFISPLVFAASSFYWPLINHNTFNVFFVIWAVYFFILGLNFVNNHHSKYQRNFIVSGFFTGISILFLQQKGFVLLLVLSSFLFIYFFIKREKIWLQFLIFYSIFSVLPVISLFLKWSPKLLYENLIIFPFVNYIETNVISFNLFFFFLIALFLAIFLLKNKDIKVKFLLYLQFFLLLATIPRPDIYHISLIVFPLLALLPLILVEINLVKNYFKYLSLSIVCFLIFIVISPSLNHIIYYNPFYSFISNPILADINNNCPKKTDIYAGTFIPGIYFETKKLNPTPFSFLITNFNTKEQFLKTREYLKKNKPQCAVLNYKIVEKFNYNKNNVVDAYIRDNYELIKKEGNILLYKFKGI